MKNDRIDTSLEGFRYVGINLTEDQYNDLRDLNTLILCNEHRQRIPVFNTMLVLKILGLLPETMLCQPGDGNQAADDEEIMKQKFGRPLTREVLDKLEAQGQSV